QEHKGHEEREDVAGCRGYEMVPAASPSLLFRGGLGSWWFFDTRTFPEAKAASGKGSTYNSGMPSGPGLQITCSGSTPRSAATCWIAETTSSARGMPSTR